MTIVKLKSDSLLTSSKTHTIRFLPLASNKWLYKIAAGRPGKNKPVDMWLSLIFIACLAGASSGSVAGDEKIPVEQGFVPRYTPVAEGKRQDLDLPAEVGIEQQKRPPAGDKKPWRRVQYGYDGVPTAAWAAPSPPAAILSMLNPLLAPGLLLLGVNLGALLYMLLGLLGLAPYRSGSASRLASHPETNSQFWPDDQSFYHRDDRHNLDEGKETAVYF